MWQKLLVSIVQALVFPLIDKAWDLINSYIEKYKARKKSEADAKAARDKMEKANTAKEIDDAADDTLSGI